MHDKTLWIMVGIPGSGKTWFAKNKLMKGRDWEYISRDEVRFSMVEDNEEYFSHEKEVFREFINQITTSLLLNNGNVIADATHLNWSSRHKLLQTLSKKVNMEKVDVIPVVIDAKLEDILERNKLRSGRERGPEEVIRKMNASMNDPEKDPYKYTAIMRVRN